MTALTMPCAAAKLLADDPVLAQKASELPLLQGGLGGRIDRDVGRVVGQHAPYLCRGVWANYFVRRAVALAETEALAGDRQKRLVRGGAPLSYAIPRDSIGVSYPQADPLLPFSFNEI